MYSRVPPLPEAEQGATSSDKDSEDNKDNAVTTTNSLATEDRKPKHVSEELWKKFKLLEKRTDEVTRHSTEKRIKHLQKTVINKVQEEITTPEDRDILHEHDVKFGPPVKEHKQNRKRKSEDMTSSYGSGEDDQKASSSEWKEVKSFLTANDHLKGVDRGKYAPKSGLEKKVDNAIQQGDFETAEKLSDKLANREFGKKIAEAIDAKNYSKQKEEEKESAKAKRKKKLPWGFEHKQRWETKSNM